VNIRCLRYFSFVAALMFASSASAVAAPNVKTVTITAKNFAFTPGVVTLKEGQPVTLKFVATEGIHGLQAPEIGLNKVVTITSTPTAVTVTPTQVGTFTEHCAIFCGAGHANMAVTFKVVK